MYTEFNKNQTPFYHNTIVWMLFVVIIILYRTFFYAGHFGYDDLHYAYLVNNLNLGNIDYSDHYSFRWTILAFTAIFYKLFGVNDLSSSMPGILIFSTILFVALLATKKHSIQTKIITLALIAFNPWLLFYGDKLMPDIYIVLPVLLVFTLLGKYKYSNKKQSTIKFGAGISISFFIGFISKGTIILIIPVLLFLFLLDIANKKSLKLWYTSALFTALWFSLYFLYFKIFYNDFWFRFNAIEANSYLNFCSFANQPLSFLIKRITIGFTYLFISSGLFIPVVFAFANIKNYTFKQLLKSETSSTFYLLVALLLVFSSNFMTISFSHYNPMCLDQRHYLFIVPIAAISASYFFEDVKNNQKSLLIPLVLFLIVFALLFYYGKWKSSWFYIPITLLLFTWPFLAKKNISFRYFTAIICSCLLLINYPLIKKTITIKYKTQKKFVTELLRKHPCKHMISDHVQCRLLNYYTAFKNPGRFIDCKDFAGDTNIIPDSVLFIQNSHTQFLTGRTMADYPYWTKYIENEIIPESEISSPFIRSYVIPQFPRLTVLKKTSIHTTPFQLKEKRTNLYIINDSLIKSCSSPSVLMQKGEVWMNEKEHAEICVTLSSKSGEIKHTTDISKFVYALSNWWEFKFDTYFTRDELLNAESITITICSDYPEHIKIKNLNCTYGNLNP